LSDELEIRNTQARFCQYLDERRFEEWSQLFTVDGDFQGTLGREAILSGISVGGLARRPELFRAHMVGNHVIEIAGDTAHVESNLLMAERDGNGDLIFRAGKYFDQMVRDSDGKWLFAQRLLDWTMNPIVGNN